MEKNRLNWITTSAKDDKYLYLTIMRDLRAYCGRGYCDVLITLTRFCELPSGLLKREYNSLQPLEKKNHIIIDWSNLESVITAIGLFFKAIHGVNHQNINLEAYHEALKEFTMYLQKQKKNE